MIDDFSTSITNYLTDMNDMNEMKFLIVKLILSYTTHK